MRYEINWFIVRGIMDFSAKMDGNITDSLRVLVSDPVGIVLAVIILVGIIAWPVMFRIKVSPLHYIIVFLLLGPISLILTGYAYNTYFKNGDSPEVEKKLVGDVRGKVENASDNNNPLENISLELYTDMGSQQQKTDKDGLYSFNGISGKKNQTFKVHPKSDGYILESGKDYFLVNFGDNEPVRMESIN